MEDDIEDYDYLKPICPYCKIEIVDCEHLLLDYDSSFIELIAGYVVDDSSEIEDFKCEIFELISKNKDRLIENQSIKDIWEFAIDNLNDDSTEIELDVCTYFNLLETHIYNFDGESFTYSLDDETPNYSSSYIIFYAKDPANTLEKFNAFILSQIK
jgi:hypothetical protein